MTRNLLVLRMLPFACNCIRHVDTIWLSLVSDRNDDLRAFRVSVTFPKVCVYQSIFLSSTKNRNDIVAVTINNKYNINIRVLYGTDCQQNEQEWGRPLHYI
jgi:hypothetical protein